MVRLQLSLYKLRGALVSNPFLSDNSHASTSTQSGEEITRSTLLLLILHVADLVRRRATVIQRVGAWEGKRSQRIDMQFVATSAYTDQFDTQ